MLVNEKFDNGKAFDWGLTSLGVANDGTSWLDLGTGTGMLPYFYAVYMLYKLPNYE